MATLPPEALKRYLSDPELVKQFFNPPIPDFMSNLLFPPKKPLWFWAMPEDGKFYWEERSWPNTTKMTVHSAPQESRFTEVKYSTMWVVDDPLLNGD